MVKRKSVDVLFWIALLWVFTPQAAHAYLDPGTGSYIIQIAVGTLLGAIFAIRSYWTSLKVKLTQLFSKQSS